jgi:hypothetical protein
MFGQTNKLACDLRRWRIDWIGLVKWNERNEIIEMNDMKRKKVIENNWNEWSGMAYRGVVREDVSIPSGAHCHKEVVYSTYCHVCFSSLLCNQHALHSTIHFWKLSASWLAMGMKTVPSRCFYSLPRSESISWHGMCVFFFFFADTKQTHRLALFRTSQGW